MAKRKATQAEDAIVEVQEVQATSQPFWEKNPNIILYAVLAVALIFGGWWAYKNLIVAPKQKEAVDAMWQAQMQFDRDSFKLALENPGGGFEGFLGIIDKFGGTPAGNLSKYYAGVCYLQMGDLDNTISYMDQFSADGDMMPIMKNGILGDAYADKGDFAKALEYYEKASKAGKNDVLAAVYLKKLGQLNDMQGNKEAAAAAFERLRTEFPNPNSPEWREVEKYIYKSGAGQK